MIFDAFGPYYGNAEMYSMSRRQRARNLGSLEQDLGTLAGAETAAFGGGAPQAILIGVTTGVLTFALTRVLERLVFSPSKRRRAR